MSPGPKSHIKKPKRKKVKKDSEYPLNTDIEVYVKFGLEFIAQLPEIGEEFGEDKAILVDTSEIESHLVTQPKSTRSASSV